MAETQDELIAKQFAAARNKLAQQKKAGEQELVGQINRQQAVTGLQGGAAMKAANKARSQYEQGFGQAEADLSAQEAAQLRQSRAEAEAKQFQKEERLGSQEFAGSQAELGRQFQSGEAEKGRQYGTQERLGSQEFAGSQAQLGREFASSERLGSQEFAGGQSALQRQFMSDEALKERQQQESQFGRSFGLQTRQLNTAIDQFNANLEYQWNEFDENVKTNYINAIIAMDKSGIDSTNAYVFARNLLNFAGLSEPSQRPRSGFQSLPPDAIDNPTIIRRRV